MFVHAHADMPSSLPFSHHGPGAITSGSCRVHPRGESFTSFFRNPRSLPVFDSQCLTGGHLLEPTLRGHEKCPLTKCL
eukprot:2077-Chlamydomonas_euryale.AAC.4